MTDEELVEEYTVEADGVPAKIEIRDEDDYVERYRLKRPQPSAATEAIMENVKQETIQQVDISTENFEDSNEVEESRRIFGDKAKELLEEQLPNLDDSEQKTLVGNLIHEMLGLGDIEILLSDNKLEEIVINSADDPAWAYHQEYGWLHTDISFESESEIYNYASEIGRGVGKNISSLHPLLDAHLPSGDRTNATLNPISTKGNTITIRKFARDPWTITDFIDIGTISPEMAAFLWMCMQYEMNIIVSGGTGSGKCLTPGSKLSLADGTLRDIDDVVESNLDDKEEIEDGWKADSNAELFSMDEHNNIGEKRAEKVWKREAPDEMLRIKTKSGRCIEATPEHPFFVNQQGRIEKLRADQMDEGDHIPSPRILEVNNSDQELAIDEWISEKGFSRTDDGKVESTRGKGVNLPESTDYELAEVAGLVIGDGHIHENGKSSCRLELHNSNSSVRESFRESVDTLFSVETSDEKREDRVEKSYSHSHVLTRFFNEIMDIPSGKKSEKVRIPEKIVRSSDETLAGFLRGYFEAEAHVNSDKSHIEIASKSENLIEQVATGLKRFGIFSRFREKEIDGETYHRLFIGPEYLELFRESIGFISQDKSSDLEDALEGPNNSNVDLVPSEDLLRRAKEAAVFHDCEIAERAGLSRRAVSKYLKGERTPSRKAFRDIRSAFERRMDELVEIEEQLQELSEELSSTSREEFRDRVLDAIKSNEVDRKTIEQETGISSGLISHWKNGSVPGSSTLSEASRLLEQKGIETEYSDLDYDRVFENIRRIRKDLKVTPSEIKEETGIDIEVYESKERETSRERVESIVSYLMDKCRGCLEDLPRELDRLETTGSSEIAWDRVEEIESFKPETDWVYDLTVPENHTFVADDLVAHNTSLLGVMTPFIPPSQRIISIEDTRELSLPEFLHWVPMTTREENPDGEGEVSMQDLLVNSLRMRPDRILVGEIRRKRQAEVLFEAMQTGHSVYSTLHADTAETTLKRMTHPPIDVPKTVVGAVDLNVVMFRDRRRNYRRVLEIAEVIDEDDESINAHTMYHWNSQDDSFSKTSNSKQVMEKLKMVTGMQEEEIEDSLEEKKEVLMWMVENEVDDIENVGHIIAQYYSEREEVLEKISEDVDAEELMPEE